MHFKKLVGLVFLAAFFDVASTAAMLLEDAVCNGEQIISCKRNSKFPSIIAHRGGHAELPENTVEALHKLQERGITFVEIDVQLTKDGIPVLYHPDDLKTFAQTVSGKIGDWNLTALQKIELHFSHLGDDSGIPFQIPTLKEVLLQFPSLHFMIDFKSLPALPLVHAVIAVMEETQAWQRCIFYSTNAAHGAILRENAPEALLFEDRDMTRGRLLTSLLRQECTYPSRALWLGFEWEREMRLEESFKLGKGENMMGVKLWTSESLACTRQKVPGAKIVWFGVNRYDLLVKAEELEIDAIVSDVPLALLQEKVQAEKRERAKCVCLLQEPHRELAQP